MSLHLLAKRAERPSGQTKGQTKLSIKCQTAFPCLSDKLLNPFQRHPLFHQHGYPHQLIHFPHCVLIHSWVAKPKGQLLHILHYSPHQYYPCNLKYQKTHRLLTAIFLKWLQVIFNFSLSITTITYLPLEPSKLSKSLKKKEKSMCSSKVFIACYIAMTTNSAHSV